MLKHELKDKAQKGFQWSLSKQCHSEAKKLPQEKHQELKTFTLNVVA